MRGAADGRTCNVRIRRSCVCYVIRFLLLLFVFVRVCTRLPLLVLLVVLVFSSVR